MAADNTSILFPAGRMVMGDLYEPNTTDAEGKPLTVKSGANAGQPRVDYFFAVAIPKTGEQHWASTPWGAQIWAAGHAGSPNAGQIAKFAWKIKDGDDATPKFDAQGKPRKPNNQREGWAGRWIVHFSSGFAPRIVSADGSQPLLEKGAVKCGFWVQVLGNAKYNGAANQPGVLINHSGVALAGYDTEITSGPDLANAGFGQGVQLPPGASATPIGAMVPPAAPGAPVYAPPPGAPAAPVYAPPPPAAPAAPVYVAPNPAFLAAGAPPAPGAPAAPAYAPPPPVAPPPAPPAPPAAGPVMSAKANGTPYAAFIAGGWTHEQLVAQGMLA